MNNNDFTQLVKQYNKLIFTVCYRFVNDYHEAENLSQETFLTAFRAISTFEGDYYKAWLVKIATNKCKDYLKSAYVRTTSPTVDDEFEAIPDRNFVEAKVEQNEHFTRILSVCDSLKEPYCTIARLHFIEEKSFGEIAQQLNIPLKTVQTQAYRAREKIKAKLKEELVNA